MPVIHCSTVILSPKIIRDAMETVTGWSCTTAVVTARPSRLIERK